MIHLYTCHLNNEVEIGKIIFDRISLKQENLLDDQFINQMLQNNNGDALPDLSSGLAEDLGMDTDMKPSINPLNNPSPAGTLSNNEKSSYYLLK